jgi:hypothetical protein
MEQEHSSEIERFYFDQQVGREKGAGSGSNFQVHKRSLEIIPAPQPSDLSLLVEKASQLGGMVKGNESGSFCYYSPDNANTLLSADIARRKMKFAMDIYYKTGKVLNIKALEEKIMASPSQADRDEVKKLTDPDQDLSSPTSPPLTESEIGTGRVSAARAKRKIREASIADSKCKEKSRKRSRKKRCTSSIRTRFTQPDAIIMTRAWDECGGIMSEALLEELAKKIDKPAEKIQVWIAKHLVER